MRHYQQPLCMDKMVDQAAWMLMRDKNLVDIWNKDDKALSTSQRLLQVILQTRIREISDHDRGLPECVWSLARAQNVDIAEICRNYKHIPVPVIRGDEGPYYQVMQCPHEPEPGPNGLFRCMFTGKLYPLDGQHGSTTRSTNPTDDHSTLNGAQWNDRRLPTGSLISQRSTPVVTNVGTRMASVSRSDHSNS